MQKTMNKTLVMWLIAMYWLMNVSVGLGQLRIVNWNTLDGPSSSGASDFRTVLSAIGSENVNGVVQRPTVLAVQEQTYSSATNLAAILNSIYGVTSYHGLVENWMTSDKLGLVYDSCQVELIDSRVVSVGYRPALRGHFRPVGYSGTEAEFYVYSAHLKAGRDYDSTRGAEAARLRLDGNNLGDGTNLIYAGDFNVYGTYETAYQNMLMAGAGKAIDSLNGSWSKITHTQNPGCDMDDRFDHQFISEELDDGEGLDLINGSYHVFGNNGTHYYNSAITTGSGASSTVLNALVSASDHLPVVVDYQLPAKMTAGVGTVPASVIKGAIVSVATDVINSADVSTASGADELDYVVTGSGAIAGSFGGIAEALGDVRVHILNFDTSVVGLQTGQISVNSSSQGVENGHYGSDSIAVTVLDHACGSFDSTVKQDTITLDFGTYAAGSSVEERTFDLFNLFGFRSNMVVWGPQGGSGETEVLSVPAETGTVLPGESLELTAAFETDQIGEFSAVWQIRVGDEDIPGATEETLEVTLQGKVVAFAGDANGDGMVDVGDLGILAANYGVIENATWAMGDFNCDGVVDVGDLGILAGNYGLGVSGTVDFDADMVKAFGENQTENVPADSNICESVCSMVGLTMIAILMVIGLMLVRQEA